MLTILSLFQFLLILLLRVESVFQSDVTVGLLIVMAISGLQFILLIKE